MDEKIINACVGSCVKANRLITVLFLAACVAIGLQHVKIEQLNNDIHKLKQERDRVTDG